MSDSLCISSEQTALTRTEDQALEDTRTMSDVSVWHASDHGHTISIYFNDQEIVHSNANFPVETTHQVVH